MVYQFDKWDLEMLNAVERELEQRRILPNDIIDRKRQLIDAEDRVLSRGKEASVGGQIFGWVFVFGFLGLIIGYNYRYSKIRSKYTGKLYYEFEEPARKNGSYMLYTSIAGVAIAFFYAIVTLQ
ncbi:MAG TPA: hypothetical protein VJU78_06520 [Chitinophagaceae bacterium]|nr:hypothetical protein [Chitinophagaceae bacterium]